MNPPSVSDTAGVFFQLDTCILIASTVPFVEQKQFFFVLYMVCVLRLQFKKSSPKQKSQTYFPAQSSVSFVIFLHLGLDLLGIHFCIC